MVLIDSLMIGMWCPLAHMCKIEGLVCYRKLLIYNSLSPRYSLMLKTLSVYMLATVSTSWMILFALLELECFAVGKLILDDFVRRNVIALIKKKSMYS